MGVVAKARFVAVLVLLGGVAMFLQARRQPETLVPYRGLALLPVEIAGWHGTEVPIPDETRDVLGKGEFLQRLYRSPQQAAPVDMFVAYFPSQRVGVTIHSPKNCLPGSGWSPIESAQISIPKDGDSITVNRYVVAKGEDRQLVLYWYQAHGRAVASEYSAKFYLVRDAMLLNRSDGSLIRIVTSMNRNETTESAQQRAVEFAQALMPALAEVVPQ
ncbi:MAG: exosortase C-terminal domain/associated protein EpsI [Candidatus Korobacteraceae bacterium]